MDTQINRIGFARVSTISQNLTLQINQLEEYGCSKIFSGKHSGKEATNKEALEKLLNYVREGDTVVVTKLDRLGRSFSQVLITLDILRKKKVSLITLHQNIDTSKDDMSSKITTMLFGLFSEIEREFILARTREGKEASGNWGGRKPKLKPQQKDQIRERLKGGESKRQLSKEFGVSRSTILNIENSA